ncbi:probable ubiquitin-conjugating enzyme E2 C [Metopolophium dirhodum]|uniref:probable ubiquitin-conjugating enzyme E2 C n=1 Tax=Metopolophium dirhodum TaxID=44670 RepID=UPI00298F502B|nr:probable ubiquitin-conjugating enzyme E2 C [Metopolophium dirhodum]XP_060871151.1 probable ubiquitin-conjugating enzyme E2 C [Metopolophium dirhodum]XP_060871152.1 probable ubiquitin-conjugating enzyme E2 C [Metopolophium dirhodum]
MAQNVNPRLEGSSSNSPKRSEDMNDRIESNKVVQRLQKELMSLMMSCDESVSAFPDGDNLFRWVATIVGPKDTVYENLKYKLSMEFPRGYPYKPPTVTFLTPCFHPNVDFASGAICLDILKEKWSAMYDVKAILISLQSLLGEPNNESPLNVKAAQLWPRQEVFKATLLSTYKESEST